MVGGSTGWVTQVSLLKDFFGASTGATVGEELVGGEGGALDAVDDVEEAEFDGVGESDPVVKVPVERESVGASERENVGAWEREERRRARLPGAPERASRANSLKRVSSPLCEDQTAMS